jgi:hypothetical protein
MEGHWVKDKQAGQKFIATWQVAYQPGILKAIGYTGGKQMAYHSCKQQNKFQKLNCCGPVKIKADGQDF